MGYTKEQRDAKKAEKDTTKTDTPQAGETTVTTPPAKGTTTMSDNDFRDFKHKPVKFTAVSRCYIEGAQLEDGQTIVLTSAGAYRQRMNGNLRVEEGVKMPTNLTEEQIKDLVEGDPRVGGVPKDFNLVQQGGPK
jgi:hypothetical protein